MDISGIELISVNRILRQENNKISRFAYCSVYASKGMQKIKLSHSRKIYHFMMVPFILRYCCGIELISVNRSLRRGKNKISQFAYCRFYVSKRLQEIKLFHSSKISHFMMVRFILIDGCGIELIPTTRVSKARKYISICLFSFLCKQRPAKDQTISFKQDFSFYAGSFYSQRLNTGK